METEELKILRVRLRTVDLSVMDYHDGEDDPAVLVNVAPSHPEDPVRRFWRREGGERELNRLRMTVPDVMMISG